jgi:5-dehydro-2-deoxygluconokinase
LIADIIKTNDPLCRGVVLLGLEAPEEDLASAFSVACDCDLVKGFAVGRTIFAQPAIDWFAGRIDDREAVDLMAGSFARLCALWTKATERTRDARQPAEAAR